MWSEDSFIALQRRRGCQWQDSTPSFHRRDERLRCPLMVRDSHSRIQASATGWNHLVQRHVASSLPPYSMRWLGDINCYLRATLARVQLECGGLVNVSALCLPLSPLSQLSLLAESSDHSVSPFPGDTVSAASGWRVAETFPEVCQPLFSCIRRQTPENINRAEAWGGVFSVTPET